MQPEILASLKKDPLRNCSVLGFFENYPLEEAYGIGDSFVLLGESDHLWAYISSESPTELKELLEKHRINTKYFSSVEEWMKPIVTKNAEVEWELASLRFILPEAQEIGPLRKETCNLDESFVDYIFEHSNYQAFTSTEYIKERLERSISAGIMEDGVLVAWGLTHDDNALGFLHVLPEYRRKGYGEAILNSLIRKRRAEKKPIFLNVEPTNHSSLNLVQKMGFVLDRKISWIKLK